jgi:hypothetical protein
LHITFRLYMTFWPAHKAMRSIAAGQNVAEKNPTKAVRPTGVFRSPSRLPAAKHIQTCYVQLRRTSLFYLSFVIFSILFIPIAIYTIFCINFYIVLCYLYNYFQYVFIHICNALFVYISTMPPRFLTFIR